MPIRSNRNIESYYDRFCKSGKGGPRFIAPSGPGAYFGARGFHAGGNNVTSATNIIGYITIANTGNATDFGDLTYGRIGLDAISNETRIVFGPGQNNSSPYYGGDSTEYDYITSATTGNATTFGETANGNGRAYVAGVSSDVRGVFGGGNEGPGSPSTKIDSIDYVTTATTGNAVDFGEMSAVFSSRAGMSNGTRGVFGCGSAPGGSNVMDYITIATTGNSTDFGDANDAHWGRGGAGNTTRGLMAGGYYTNEIEYITIANTGNGTDFGDLSPDGNGVGGCNNETRAVFVGGEGTSASTSLRYVTIASTGNSSDFGDSINPGNNNYMCGASGAAS